MRTEDAEPHAVPEGERRHLTVLFSDLVGSTEIAAQLDPEEWREVVRQYHRAAAEAIERFGGSVAQYLGDGVMAYFGYPEAHDNDAECAVTAGLAILDAIANLNEQSMHPRLSARVGIDSGGVVVAAGSSREADVFGDTPNIAARVQAAAEPDTVVITDAAHRLVSGLFVVEDRGTHPLKGIDRPVQLFRVVQPSGVRGRLQALAAARGLTPFVGREDELRLLVNRWERVLDGEGQVALIIGEAGIGKSRLVHRFHEQISGTPHTWVEAAAKPFHQNTPFYPVTELFRDLLARRGDESAEEQLAQLETRLMRAGLKPAEALPLFVPLLNLPIPLNYPPTSLSPEQQRRRLLATLVEWLLSATRLQATVVAIEDLHWADPSTLELIQLAVEQGATARLLLLYTARPEFYAQWPPRAHHTQITLNRLSARHVRTMVEEVAARKALSAETVAAMVERTGGVPLFVEELTHAVLESGDGKFAGREIPVTLHDSLMARLDRMGPAREVIQVGAVIGGEFSYELLRAVHPIAEQDLQNALRTLADAELLYVRGIAPEASYQFKHVLIRDAAYEALLKSRRKELHRLVAHTIDEGFPALKEAQPEVLARHWTEAGENERAIAEWSRAGDASRARHAFGEALESYGEALALLRLFPESRAYNARGLTLYNAFVQVLQITQGYLAPETVEAAARARSLAEKLGDLGQLILQEVRTWRALFVRGDYEGAAAVGDRILILAQRQGQQTKHLVFAHSAQVQARFYRGDLMGVEDHFAHLSGLGGAADLREPGDRVITRGVIGLTAWMMGRTELAHKRIAKAMASGQDANNPYDLAFGLLFEGYLYRFLREPQRAKAAASQMLELSEQHGFSYGRDLARGVLGWARAQLGDVAGGLSLIRQALTGFLQAGTRVGITDVLTRLAEAQALDGATAAALDTLEEALQANSAEFVFRPNIMTWRGNLRMTLGQTEAAEADFCEAIKMAKAMSAKAYELRARTSLARLLAKRGKRDDARAMLAEIYDWFTEGFDTADLKDAKALLDELSN